MKCLRLVFAAWGTVLRARPAALLEMAAAYAVVLLAAVLASLGTLLSGAAAVVLWVLGIAVFLSLLSFTVGAAFAAIGEAVRGDAPTPYIARGRAFFWRTLGTIGFAMLLALPSLIVGTVALAILVATVISSFDAGVSGGAGLVDTSLLLFLASFCLGLVSTPVIYSLEAGVFVGGSAAGPALRAAFPEAFTGRRFWRWLLVALIIAAFGALSAFLRSVPGVLGVFLGSIAAVLALWLGISLAFANWKTNRA